MYLSALSKQHEETPHEEDSSNGPVLTSRAQEGSNKDFTRPLVFLEKKLPSVPQKSRLEALKKDGRVKDITFKMRHSPREIGRLMLASFPALLGMELSR